MLTVFCLCKEKYITQWVQNVTNILTISLTSYYRIDPDFCSLIIAICPLTMSALNRKAQNPSKVTEEKVRSHHSILISLCITEVISEPEIAFHLIKFFYFIRIPVQLKEMHQWNVYLKTTTIMRRVYFISKTIKSANSFGMMYKLQEEKLDCIHIYHHIMSAMQ